MNQKAHTVLVVEDHELNREILCEILKDEYNILTAVDGIQCLQALRDHFSEIDVVLLDLMMPEMDGYDVLKEVSHDSLLREIPVVVMTGADADEEELRCLKLGAMDFLRKPYDPQLIHLRINNIIRLTESMQANKQKVEFISNINHEIRTPLNAILGFSQLLGMPAGYIDDDEKAKYVNYIVNNSKKLLWMIEDALILSNADSSKLSIEKTDTPINNICREAINTTELSCPDGIRLYMTTDVADAFSVHTDANRTQQIVVNLVTNAFKWTTSGEVHLHCSYSEKKRYATISVTDTGIGIPKDKAEYIFERFTKLDSFMPGNGLGLTISRQLATMLGGLVYLDTDYTDGARFVLQLPITGNTTKEY